MALDKDALGLALYSVRTTFGNKTIQELETAYGSMEGAREAACKAEAEEIINHFINNVQLIIPGTGFISASPGSPVTGVSTTGEII